MKVYVHVKTRKVYSESGKNKVIWNSACRLAEDPEYFEEFLGQYKRSELLKFGAADGIAINLDFMNACRERAERDFKDWFIETEILD